MAGEKILIVDDEEDIREVLADRLEAKGYVTDTAVNGLLGLEAIWIEDVMPRYGHGQKPPDVRQEQDRIQLVWFFDYLIYRSSGIKSEKMSAVFA